MRRALFFFGSFAAVGIFIACASDGVTPSVPPAPVNDGSALDASFGNDAALANTADADPGPGDVCGDATGLNSTGPWPLAGGCPTRAGYSMQHSPATTAVRTIVPLAGGPGSAAIASGTLWIGATDGTVYHANAGGGVLHQLVLPAAVKSTPAIDAAGNAIITCEDGFLYALDTEPVDAGAVDASATPLANVHFKVRIGKSDGSPVIAPDGTIYVGTNDGNLVAVASAGTVKWKMPTGDTLGSSPALGQNGAIYVGSTDHMLRAFNADGTVQWSLDVGAEMHASPAVGGDGTLYAATADGKLHAVTTDGKEKWTYSGAGGAFVGTPAVYAGQIYAANEDKKLYAVATADGSPRWAFATQGTPTTPIVDADSRLDFGSSDGHVYVISDKGTLYIAGTARAAITGGTAISTQGVFVVTASGLEVMGP